MSKVSSVNSKRENELSSTTQFVMHMIFIFLALAAVLPVVLVIIISFTSGDSIRANGYSFFPDKMVLTSYTTIFKDYETILRGYSVSIGITVIGTILSVVLMALYAYPISRADYPFRTFFTFFLFFTMLFNGGLVSKYLIYTQLFHLRDNYIALILPLLIVPFNVIIMRTFFQTTIHPAVIESARIDGAGELRIFARIVLPLSLPVMATMSLFSTINYWNDWFNALVFINNEKMYPLQYLMMRVLNEIQYLRDQIEVVAANPALTRDLPDESLQMAMAVLGMGPILVVYPFFQKYFVKGLTVGSVKG
ncbi:carbohydrate ABC transporter permease [Paenibacillus sp. HB172176]|uniref:carbohydrate ABC transporter permease n=1 Tax=Paenibacillus sp. HB172176 TaxID=2493690 RepID=UPI0014396E33|nr:carbohydrate ABC transporter permease [Paenibacillus sp. HB172176]